MFLLLNFHTLMKCFGRFLFTRVMEISAGISNGLFPVGAAELGSSSSISKHSPPELNRISPGSSEKVISGVIIISSAMFASLEVSSSSSKIYCKKCWKLYKSQPSFSDAFQLSLLLVELNDDLTSVYWRIGDHQLRYHWNLLLDIWLIIP